MGKDKQDVLPLLGLLRQARSRWGVWRSMQGCEQQTCSSHMHDPVHTPHHAASMALRYQPLGVAQPGTFLDVAANPKVRCFQI